MVDFLVSAGINVNQKTKTGDTALHWLCSSSEAKSDQNRAEIVKELLAAGADPGWPKQAALPAIAGPGPDSDNYQQQQQQQQRALEEADVYDTIDGPLRVPRRRETEWTPLHRACCQKLAEVVRALLIAGAEVNPMVSLERQTPLHRASEHGCEGVSTTHICMFIYAPTVS